MDQLRVSLTGAPITGPAVSTYYAEHGTFGVRDAIFGMWDDWKAVMPPGITITVPNTGWVMDEATGAITGTWGSGGDDVLNSSAASGAFPQGSGGLVRWQTSTVHAGRLVRGRTFVVPLAAGAYNAQGGMNPSNTGFWASSISDMLTAAGGHFVIWSRPRPGTPGVIAPVVSGSMRPQVTSLRSRRT